MALAVLKLYKAYKVEIRGPGTQENLTRHEGEQRCVGVGK